MDPNSMMDKKKAAYYMRNSPATHESREETERRGQGTWGGGMDAAKMTLIIIAVILGLVILLAKLK